MAAARVAMAPAAACFDCSSWFLVDFRFAQLDAYSMFWDGGYIYSRDLRHVFQNCWRPRGMGSFESQYQHALEIQNHDTYLAPFLTVWYSCMVLVLYYFLYFYRERRISMQEYWVCNIYAIGNIIPLYSKKDCCPFLLILQQIIFEIENLFLGIDITSSGRQPWADFVLDLREQIQTYETNRG